MKRLFLLFSVTACFVAPASASENTFTFERKRVRPSEMIHTLRSLSAFGVSFKEEDRNVIVAVGDHSLFKRVEERIEVIAAPPSGVPVRFIKLRFADVTHIAEVISQAFPARADNDELPLQAVPNLRTNEVFLMGTVKEIQAAEALVRLLDRAQASARRGCGDLGF